MDATITSRQLINSGIQMNETHDPKQDGDLESAFDHHLQESINKVESILAQISGEADGPNWYWILKMKDGRFALVVGGCDYTGWDCQSDAEISFHDTAENAAIFAKDDYTRKNIAEQLLKQLKGEQPYALYIEPENE